MTPQLLKGKLSIADEIYNGILTRIIEGDWEIGSKLPSEHELCDLFDASRVSVRTALSRLSERGMIETRQGKGSFVKSAGAVSVAEGANESGGNDSVRQFFVFRQSIETKAAELFIRKATEADYDDLQSIVNRMGKAKGDEELIAADLEFHKKIMAVSGNFFLIECMDYFHDDYERNFRRSHEKNRKSPKALKEEHQEILNALKEGDLKKAMSIILQGFFSEA